MPFSLSLSYRVICCFTKSEQIRFGLCFTALVAQLGPSPHVLLSVHRLLIPGCSHRLQICTECHSPPAAREVHLETCRKKFSLPLIHLQMKFTCKYPISASAPRQRLTFVTKTVRDCFQNTFQFNFHLNLV